MHWGWQSIYVAAVTIGSLALLISGKATIDVLGIAMLVALVASGIVPVKEALAGFSDSTIVTLAGLYVISEGLTRTGALEFVARATLRFSRGSETRARLILCATAAAISSVVSDTAVVLVFLPVALGVARDLRLPPSRFLMPISFCALLGGTMTLVGTSINLFASSAAEKAHAAPLGFFEMTPIALPLNVVGVLGVALLARRFLPDRTSVTGALTRVAAREYVTELVIGPQSPLLDKPYSEAFPEGGPRLVFFVRDERTRWPPFVGGTVQKGDVILLQGDVQQLSDFQAKLGLKMVGGTRFDPRTMAFTELAVTPRSRLVGRRISDLNLARDYDVMVVAVLREGHVIRERASDLELRAGDLLLVCGREDSQAKLSASTDFYLLTGTDQAVVLRQNARRALMVLGAVIAIFVATSSFETALPMLKQWLPLPLVSLAGAVAMVAAGCLTSQRAYRVIDFRILIFVVGMLALGHAIDATGIAKAGAQGVVALLHSFGPLVVVSGFLLLTTLLNQCIAPYALVVLLTPVAIEAARQLGADLRPFILAVAFGGSNAFSNPMGHQVNLMVLGPGGYKYGDFLRFGIPMVIVMWLIVTAGLWIKMHG